MRIWNQLKTWWRRLSPVYTHCVACGAEKPKKEQWTDTCRDCEGC
jgi:hypothetical protein